MSEMKKIILLLSLALFSFNANAGITLWAWIYVPTIAEITQFWAIKTATLPENYGQVVYKDPKDPPLDDPKQAPGWHRAPTLDLDI